MDDQYPLVNQAQVQSDQTLPAYDSEVTIVNAPVLALHKSANPSPVQANGLLTFTLTYSNEGHADSQAVLLTDTIPNHTDWVVDSCQPGCQQLGDALLWSLGTLSKGGGNGAASFRVAVHDSLDDGTLLVNRADLGALYGYTRTATLTTVVLSVPALTLALASNAEPVRVTDALVYTLTFANAGNGPAHAVVLTDLLPSAVTYQSGCRWEDRCVLSGRHINLDA